MKYIFVLLTSFFYIPYAALTPEENIRNALLAWLFVAFRFTGALEGAGLISVETVIISFNHHEELTTSSASYSSRTSHTHPRVWVHNSNIIYIYIYININIFQLEEKSQRFCCERSFRPTLNRVINNP